MGTFITKEELQVIQEMNNEFNKAKLALGDIELQKVNIIKAIDEMKMSFAQHEKSLVEKYGTDSVINIQTGELTKKEN